MVGRAIRSFLAIAALIGLASGWAQPAPIPLEPLGGAVLDNGRTDRDDDLEWRFRWEPVAAATGYQLRVVPPSGDRPAIDVVTTAPHHLELRPGAYVADGDRNGWAWTVRARFGTAWGPWSRPHAFAVEAVDSDPPLRALEPAACPALRAPSPGAALDEAAVGEVVAWRFEWTACPGADAYAIVVQCAGSTAPLLVHEGAATAFTLVRCGPPLGVDACGWRVRAHVDGAWAPWTAARPFRVVPVAPELEPEGLHACTVVD